MQVTKVEPMSTGITFQARKIKSGMHRQLSVMHTFRANFERS